MTNFLHRNRTKSREIEIKMTKSGRLNEKQDPSLAKRQARVLFCCTGGAGQAKVEKGSFT